MLNDNDEEAVIRSNIGLVRTVLKSYRKNKNYDELFQEGCIGLLRAHRTYDSTRGKWSSHASIGVHWAVVHYLSNHWSDDSTVSLDAPLSDDSPEGATLHDIVGDPRENTEASALDHVELDMALAAINDPAQRALILRRIQGASLREIGESEGLTAEAIRYRQKGIISRLYSKDTFPRK
jgi:RNA polymerase sigma factor (sigma-70 family)